MIRWLIVLLVLAAPAWAGPVRCADDGEGGACVWGRAEAYDGGAVQVRGLRIQLQGITVPTRRDLCAKAGVEEFDCSRPARKRMGELLARGIACDIADAAAGHLIGRCRVAEGDLGRLLVTAGVARAAKDGPYDEAQGQAQAQKKGLWSADITPPRDWETARRKSGD